MVVVLNPNEEKHGNLDRVAVWSSPSEALTAKPGEWRELKRAQDGEKQRRPVRRTRAGTRLVYWGEVLVGMVAPDFGGDGWDVLCYRTGPRVGEFGKGSTSHPELEAAAKALAAQAQACGCNRRQPKP